MSFRDYQNCTAKCVVCNDPKELEKEINKIQKKYTIIDLQYSTHLFYSNLVVAERYSVFLLISPKEGVKK